MMKRYILMIKTAEIDLQSVYHFSDIENENLQNILYEYLDAYEYEVPDLIDLIKKFKVGYNPRHKISKYALQIYSFFYDRIMNFPTTKFDEIKTVSTPGFITALYRVINCKVHIHHSHVTGKIIGYAHDFCNWRVRENNYIIPLIGHNFLGFDIYYMVKGFRASVWETSSLNMGGTTLTNMNYANIANQVKIIDTIKYYQTSLANISNTATFNEKVNIENTVIKFIEKHSYFSKNWLKLNQETKNKIVSIISKGKGAIPYEKIIDMNSLNIKPENDFFEYTEYFSSLNDKNIELDIYQDMKFLYKSLKMRNLGDINDLYNMQNVILLCEIIENRFQKMQDKFGFNPRKCNLASTLSGCVQRDQSKVIISLPTNFKHAEIFEKTLIGGFTCVNTRIGFDAEVLLPNFEKKGYSNMNIDESFQAYKNQNYKVAYKIKLDNDPIDYERRVISKILKFDENNQYGFAMTKPMPVGCIKEKQADYLEFNLLFEKVNLDDRIGHIFVVDIEFNYKEATKTQVLYNEIMPPFIEKNTKIPAEKKSVYQLLELYSEDKNGKPNKYKISVKVHANLFPKKCIPLYLEEIKFAVLRCGWKVTKLYQHFYFDQERCKKNFILMNQKARQEATDKVESDFCKLLNNSNFGYDCRNNLDNLTFQPIRDELNELNFIKKYYTNLYNSSIKEFVTSKVIEEDINERYNNEMLKVKPNDKFYSSKVSSIENRKRSETESLEKLKERESKHHKKKDLHSYFDVMDKASNDTKIKNVIDFSEQDVASVKAIAVKKKDKVKITTRFMKGKMLMFSKISLKSFVYDVIDIFCFPDSIIADIYNKNDILKVFIYLILTDTDSCSLQFTFINKLSCSITEDRARDIIFEILILKLADRLDTSHEFFERFSCRNLASKKVVGLYEVESIDNPNVVTIAVNPKEYLEVLRNKELNKKHKGIKKPTPGMNFESFSSKIIDTREYTFAQKKSQSLKQSTFKLSKTTIHFKEELKVQFAGLNDKRYYLPDGVTSLPYGHFLLTELDKEKNKKNIQNVLFKIKDDLIREESNLVKKCERICVLRSILNQIPTYYKLDSLKRPAIRQLTRTTKDYILSGLWQ